MISFEEAGFKVSPVAIRGSSFAIDRVNMWANYQVKSIDWLGVCSGMHPFGAQKESESGRRYQNYDFRCSWINSTNFLAILSSSQSTVPRSIDPKVITFLWTITNCLLSRCNSDRVILRGGSVIHCLRFWPMKIGMDPPFDWDEFETIVEIIAVEVFSRIFNVSTGAFAT